MTAQFAHYWQEGIILTEEEREHQRKIEQALNQGVVYTVPEGSELNGNVHTNATKHEIKIMMFIEDGTPLHMWAFFLNDEPQPEDDDEIGKRLAEREPSEKEPAIFLTSADKNAATSWVFFQ